MPAWQLTAVALVDPAGHAYPAEQGPVHAEVARPGVPPNSPAGQLTHTEAPTREYVPAAQAVQLDRVADAVNRPAGHWEHVPAPAALKLPGWQGTAVADVEPAGHAYLRRTSRHAARIYISKI